MRRIAGEHTPNNKNRSSKQLTWLTKIRDSYRSMSGEMLNGFARNGNYKATGEIERRKKIHEKNEVRKARYMEKLAQKRVVKK